MINALIRVDVRPFNVDVLCYFSTFGHYLWFLRDSKKLLSSIDMKIFLSHVDFLRLSTVFMARIDD